MQNAKLSLEAMEAMRAERGLPGHRKLVSELFRLAKAHYSIPVKHRLRADIDAVGTPMYGVIVRKKTGERYMRNERLIPAYPLPAPPAEVIVSPQVWQYSRVRSDAALALLKAIAPQFGQITTKPKAKPTWLGTHAVEGKLVVPVGSKSYSLDFESAMNCLTIYGEPCTLNQPKEGHGGALADQEFLYIPA